MKNVYIAKLAGEHKFSSTLIGLAFHCGFTPKVAPAYAARVKGKIEHTYTLSFWFKNTRNKSRWETTALPVMTFIERFLYHVQPKQFHHMRYYSFLANGKAGPQIQSIRQILSDRIEPDLETAH